MELILDASRNKKFLDNQEEEMIERIKDPDDAEASRPRKRELKEAYIPEKEIEELRKMYSYVVVQDFEDEYHMSRTERKELKERYSKFFKLRQNFTKKIRKLDKYVEACRLVIEIINDMAENNGILDPDEYRRKTLKGDLTIDFLMIPKYIGKGKKNINWDYVMEYILDPTLDPKDLVRDTINEINNDEDESLTDGQVEALVDKAINNDDKLDRPEALNPEDYGSNFAAIADKKDKKSLMKGCPSYLKIVKEIDRATSKSRENAMIWQLDKNDLAWIEEYDKRHNKKTLSVPEFTGDITKKSDVDAYLFQVEEYQRETELVEYHNSYVTKEDYDELKFKEILERNNYNLRNLYGNKEREKRKIAEQKANKKKIKSLKKMLAKLQGTDGDKGVGLSGDIKSYTKEELESGGKINKKKHKSSKKSKKKADKTFDDMLLSSVGSNADSMKDYYKSMSSMSLLK